MKKIILSSAILLFTLPAFASSECKDQVYQGVFPATKAKVTIICKNGFAIGYSKGMKTLLWTAHRIDRNVKYTINSRPAFHKDAQVPTDRQSSNTDFVGTGFDKGHMVPFEDMSYSAQSAYDSMSLTNIVPQNHSNNRGGWKSLESRARKMAKYGPIFVVSGPIFEGRVDSIGNRIPIPTKLFKVIIDPITKTSRTWILPNEPVAAIEVQRFIATRSEVTLSGINPTPNATIVDQK